MCFSVSERSNYYSSINQKRIAETTKTGFLSCTWTWKKTCGCTKTSFEKCLVQNLIRDSTKIFKQELSQKNQRTQGVCIKQPLNRTSYQWGQFTFFRKRLDFVRDSKDLTGVKEDSHGVRLTWLPAGKKCSRRLLWNLRWQYHDLGLFRLVQP